MPAAHHLVHRPTLFALLLFLCAFSIALLAVPRPTSALSNSLVISQVYGGGGNSGAPYRNDFIEVFNRGNNAVNVSGWSVQYATMTGTLWSVTALADTLIPPGGYLLIQEASGGANGALLPTPDVTDTHNMAAASGKVALV